MRSTIDKLVAARGGVDVARPRPPSTRGCAVRCSSEVDVIVERSRPDARAVRGAGRGRGVPRRRSRGGSRCRSRRCCSDVRTGARWRSCLPHGRFEHGDLFERGTSPRSTVTPLQIASNPELIGRRSGRSSTRTARNGRWRRRAAHRSSTRCCTCCRRGTCSARRSRRCTLRRCTQPSGCSSAADRVVPGRCVPARGRGAELQALYELALDPLHRVYASPESALGRRARLALGGPRRRAAGAADIAPGARRGRVVRRARPRHHHARAPGPAAVAADLEASMVELAQAVERSGFDSIFTPTDAQLAG